MLKHQKGAILASQPLRANDIPRKRLKMNPRRRVLAKLFLASAAAARFGLRPASAQAEPVPPNPRLGINLAGPSYYNTELPFVDVFRMARDWEVKFEDGRRSAVPELDGEGWIARLPAGTWAETPLAVLGRIPQGVWTVLYEGSGRIEMWGRVELLGQEPGRIRFRVAPHDPAVLWLRVWRTDPANPVRKIRVLMPGHEESYRGNPWQPSFLQRWKGMAALRFMDWMVTNNSAVARWAERPRLEHASFSGRGIALELLVDLANRLAIDPWFCLPHLADDDYIERFAALVKATLDPALKIYIEYSNEVWNALFGQQRHAIARGRSLRLARDDFEAGLRYAGRRSLEMFAIWERVFGGRARLVRVIAAQAVNSRTASAMLPAADASRRVDALAIAPYIGLAISPASRPTEAEASRWTLEDLFRALDTEFAGVRRAMRENAALARRHGLRLLAYEGGQHLIAIHGAENNEALEKLFRAANRDPRMGEIYRRMYHAWDDAGGDLFCHFSSVSPASKWGNWGLLEYHDSPPGQSPKLVESLRWARSRAQNVAVPRSDT
jgi:hypothetical protein